MSMINRFPIDQWHFNSDAVLHNLPDHEIESLLAHQSVHTYPCGHILFREGSFASGIFFIKEGKVKKYKVDAEGKENIIYIANKGELLGYHGVLGGGRYCDSTATLEKTTVVFVPKEDFIATVAQSPILTWRLLKTLSHEFNVLSNSISLFRQKTVIERLALQLIVLREKYKPVPYTGAPVTISICREDLASLVGTARENIVRLLKGFKTQNILTTHGRKIVIKDVAQLIKIADYKQPVL